MRGNIGEWGKNEEMFLSCPPGVESLATPLPLCVVPKRSAVEYLGKKQEVLWVVISEIQTLEKIGVMYHVHDGRKTMWWYQIFFLVFFFLLEYCGESSQFDVSNGEITNISSPRYPEIFRSKITCEYTITAHSSGRVILSFLTFAFLGIGDIFVVGNGHDHKNESSILLSHKNNVVPPIVTSMAHHMWISFTTDGVQNRNTWFFIQVQQINDTGKLWC